MTAPHAHSRSPRPPPACARRRAACGPARPVSWFAAFAAAWLACAPAVAERADRDKPLSVEADSMTYDDAKQVNVFAGKVTMTKGTIVIRADRIVVRQDAEGNQFGLATGNPATFRQKRDGVDEFVTGSGQQIEYDGKTETFRLRERANLKRLEKERVTDEVHGNLIVYDTRNEFFSVDGGGPASATPENPTGRVRVVIQPKTGKPAAPAPAAPLQPAKEMEAPRR